jgi:hypothetical protein
MQIGDGNSSEQGSNKLPTLNLNNLSQSKSPALRQNSSFAARKKQ